MATELHPADLGYTIIADMQTATKNFDTVLTAHQRVYSRFGLAKTRRVDHCSRIRSVGYAMSRVCTAAGTKAAAVFGWMWTMGLSHA